MVSRHENLLSLCNKYFTHKFYTIMDQWKKIIAFKKFICLIFITLNRRTKLTRKSLFGLSGKFFFVDSTNISTIIVSVSATPLCDALTTCQQSQQNEKSNQNKCPLTPSVLISCKQYEIKCDNDSDSHPTHPVLL